MPVGDEYELAPVADDDPVRPSRSAEDTEPPAYTGDLDEMGIGARAFYEGDFEAAHDYIDFMTDGEDETFVGVDEAYCMLSFGRLHDDMADVQDWVDGFCARNCYEGGAIGKRWYRIRLDPPGLRRLVDELPEESRVHLWNGV